MERGPTVVVDASVAVKWFNEEEFSEEAFSLRRDHVEGRTMLVAPAILPYEVVNALRYNPDFGSADVAKASRDLGDIQIRLIPWEEEIGEETVHLAFERGLTVYDASYLVLASHLRCQCYSGDRRQSGEPEATHISEYEGPGSMAAG